MPRWQSQKGLSIGKVKAIEVLQAIQGAEPFLGILLAPALVTHPWITLGLATFREVGAAASVSQPHRRRQGLAAPALGLQRAQSLSTPHRKVSV